MQILFRSVFAAVPPHGVNLTTTLSTVSAAGNANASCCAKGYPQPIIRINGNTGSHNTYNLMNGVYEGCASLTINTSSVTFGADLTLRCDVSLSQSLNCTTKTDNGPAVDDDVIAHCNAALGAKVNVSTTATIVGKSPLMNQNILLQASDWAFRFHQGSQPLQFPPEVASTTLSRRRNLLPN